MPRPRKLDRELRLLKAVARAVPPVPRATVFVNRLLKPWYLRKPRSEVVADVLGSPMRLDPAEAIDAVYLFSPHLYDRREVAFVRRELHPGDCFVDIGAHIGFYSLVAARAVGPTGQVVAIEPEASTFRRLRWNLEANDLAQVIAIRLGVSDRDEVRRLGVNECGNRGGSSFLADFPAGEHVQCKSLLDIVRQVGLNQIAGMKLDVEGDEARVLFRFFADAEEILWPRFLILEDRGNASIAEELAPLGYSLHSRHFGNAWNAVLVRSGGTGTRTSNEIAAPAHTSAAPQKPKARPRGRVRPRR